MTAGRLPFTFGPNPLTNPPLAGDFIFNTASAVVDDSLVETNEGFVLFIEVDENNNVDDTVLISNRVTLVTIRDNDGEGFSYCYE